jgi:hypothetical protein
MSSLTDPERWRAISPYLDQALDLSDEARGPWLAGLRASDPGLAADLQGLLAEREIIHRTAFLEKPAVIISVVFFPASSFFS